MNQKVVRARVLLTVQHENGVQEEHTLVDDQRAAGFFQDLTLNVSLPYEPEYKNGEQRPIGLRQKGPKLTVLTIKDYTNDQRLVPTPEI